MNEPHPLSPMSALRHGLTDFNEALRDDSYINFATGLGLPGTDKSRATYYARERLLQPTELQNMYQSNAYATRIVDRLVDDATRVDWYLTGVDRKFDWNSVKSQVDDLGGLSSIGDAWRWARLYGGGLAVMPIDDGQHYSKPLDLAGARKIRPLTTLDSSTTLVRGYMASLGSVAWSQPTGYQVLVPVEGTGGGFAMVHPSRVIRFDGCRVPAAMMVSNGGWAPSVLQRCKKQLEAYGAVLGYAQEILHDISVMLVKLPGFNAAMLGDSGIANAREILRQLRWGIDNLNLLVMDSGSDYQEIKRSVDGLEKLINAFERDLVGASGMSRLILTGEQASGLGASSSDEVRSWYDSVGKEQKFTVTPALNRLLQVIFAIRANAGEPVPTEWSIRYEALWTPEPKARAEIAQIWVQTINEAQMTGLLEDGEGKALLVRNGVLEDLPEADDTDTVPGPNDLDVDPTATATPDEEQSPAEPQAEWTPAHTTAMLGLLDQVRAGTLAAVTAEWLIGKVAPVAVATPAELAKTREAIAAAAAMAQPIAPPAAEQAPTDDDEPDPLDTLLAEIPSDLMTPEQAAAEIKKRTGLDVSVQRIHSLAKRHGVRSGWVGNARGYSLADIKRALASDNGLELPTAESEPDETIDAADGPDLATIQQWLREHYSMAPKLSRPRIAALVTARSAHAFLQAPAVSRVYRGLANIKPTAVGKLLAESDPVKDKCWTTDYAVAARFAAGEMIERNEIDPEAIGVVLVAEADQRSLLLNAPAIASMPEVGQHFNEIWGETLARSIREESEVIACGPLNIVQVRAVLMANNPAQTLTLDQANAAVRASAERSGIDLLKVPVADKTDGRECSLTISVRPPRSIAQWVPYNPDQPVPPHVTIIHCKDVYPRQASALVEALQDLARTVAPVPLTTAGVGYFDHETQRIAWTGIEGEQLGPLHAAVMKVATAAGINPETHESGYVPHMTLAQIGLGEEYAGASPPVGSTWDADALIVEFGETTTILPLTGNATDAGEVA